RETRCTRRRLPDVSKQLRGRPHASICTRRCRRESSPAWISTRRSFAKTVAKGRRISADLWTQRPDQQRTSDQQKPVYPTRINRSLDANRVLWKAESPD